MERRAALRERDAHQARERRRRVVRAAAAGVAFISWAIAADAPAVSLHIYGVPGAQIATHVNDIVQADLPMLA